ncbi:MAG: helix-turn-helix transcriptional regulator [Eubacteriales bacterium]|nr:helix-turn-helix transcriptional regulator [Eubacteriales bacterium]
MKSEKRKWLEDLIYLTGRTKREFAEEVGISPMTLTAIISGKSNRPKPYIVDKMAPILGVGVIQLRAMFIGKEVA